MANGSSRQVCVLIIEETNPIFQLHCPRQDLGVMRQPPACKNQLAASLPKVEFCARIITPQAIPPPPARCGPLPRNKRPPMLPFVSQKSTAAASTIHLNLTHGAEDAGMHRPPPTISQGTRTLPDSYSRYRSYMHQGCPPLTLGRNRTLFRTYSHQGTL